MREFSDNARPQPRRWLLEINVGQAKRVRDLVGVDFFALAKKGAEGLDELLSDPIKLVDVLYVLCKDQCDKACLTDEDFGAGMAGDAISAAADAFIEELIDFFPQERVRSSLRRLVAAGRKVRDRVMERAESLAGQLDPEKIADELIARMERESRNGSTSGRSSGTSPESSAFTLARSPSANSA